MAGTSPHQRRPAGDGVHRARERRGGRAGSARRVSRGIHTTPLAAARCIRFRRDTPRSSSSRRQRPRGISPHAVLPLGIAVAMHLYPLCVLQCIPLPLLSFARFQRAMLLRTIRNRSLILANAGSERTREVQPFPGCTSGRRRHSNRWNVRIHVARHCRGRRPLQGAAGKQREHRSLCGRPARRLGAHRRLEILRKHAAFGHIVSDLYRAPGTSRPLCARGRR